MIEYLIRWKIKIACVLLAICFWYVSKEEETITKTFNISVIPRISEELSLLKLEPSIVEVTLKGSRRKMTEVKKNYSMDIDLLSEKEPKIFQKYLTENDFSFDPELKIVRFVPEKVEIEIDRIVEKYIEVEASVEGKAGPNYELTGIKIVPFRLKVSGPEKFLRQTQKLITEKIDVEGMTTNFMQHAQIIPPYPGFLSKLTVNVFISISKSKVKKVFNDVPVAIMQTAGVTQSCTMKPEKVKIKISASIYDLQGTQKNDITPFIDIKGFSSGTYELPLSFVSIFVYWLL